MLAKWIDKMKPNGSHPRGCLCAVLTGARPSLATSVKPRECLWGIGPGNCMVSFPGSDISPIRELAKKNPEILRKV